MKHDDMTSTKRAHKRARRRAEDAKSRRVADAYQFNTQQPISNLPQDVMNIILSAENLPDPIDLT